MAVLPEPDELQRVVPQDSSPSHSKQSSSLARLQSLEPEVRSYHAFGPAAAGEQAKAVAGLPHGRLRELYPMLCFCEPGGAQAPCWHCPGGHRGRLPLPRKLLWAWPALAWFALKYMKVGYMKKFYTDDYPRASLGVIAFSSVLSVLVDAFTDPRMALWTDNLKSRFGRRRPFVLASAFFGPTVFILSWLPMVDSGMAASIWFAVFHIAYKLADTLYVIPFDAWGAQLTPAYKEKTNVWLCRELMAGFGIFFGMAVAPLLFVTKQCSSTPDDGCAELPLLAAFFGLVFAEGCLRLVYLGKEPRTGVEVVLGAGAGSAFSEKDAVPVLISTFLNQPFRILLVSAVAKAVGQEIPFNVLPYMTAWVVGEKCFAADTFLGYLVVGNLLCGLGSVFGWTWLAGRSGKFAAYVCFNVALCLSSVSFALIGYDSGDCAASYATLALTCVFGAAYGGSFLTKDLVSDVIDYDELLTGGMRREASYLMAIDFLPKFMNIPGECVPFLLLAYYSYRRPLSQRFRPLCGPGHGVQSGLSPDAFCEAFYRNETAGAGWCSDAMPCSEYVAGGASFVCSLAHGECGLVQNTEVRLVLLSCFSVVPFACMLLSLCALSFYPRCARSEAMQERLLEALSRLRRGEEVEDPWRPGSMVAPAPAPTPNAGALSYFTPSELRACATAAPLGDGAADTTALWRMPFFLAVASAALIPVGVVVVGLGLEDLFSDLGASVAPLGLMVAGLGVLGAWFHGTRAAAALDLGRRGARRSEVVAKYNQLCPFTSDARMLD